MCQWGICRHPSESVDIIWLCSALNTTAVADPGFPVGRVDLVGGGVDSRGGYISKKLCVQNERIWTLGGRATGTPPLDPPMHCTTYLNANKLYLPLFYLHFNQYFSDFWVWVWISTIKCIVNVYKHIPLIIDARGIVVSIVTFRTLFV